MGKFSTIVVMADASFKRYWMNVEMVIHLLKEHKDAKVYKCSNEQQAILTPDGNAIVWKDIPMEDYKVG